jgi:hypothetical protein
MKGFWNGLPAEITPVTYEIGPHTIDAALWWSKRLEGKRRQGLKVEQDGNIFFIDNEYGDGYYKVTTGKGMPEYGHKSAHNPINIYYKSFVLTKRKVALKSLQKEQQSYFDWVKNTDAEAYTKMVNAHVVKEHGKGR